MQMTDDMEFDFPPVPPPPSMTDAQREMADAAIAAAIARAREKRRMRNLMARDLCFACRMGPGKCDDAAERAAPLGRRQRAKKGRTVTAYIGIGELPVSRPRQPDLHAANLSFAARVIIWVRDRFSNNAPAVYKAAYLSRKTYSAIISDETHVVSKRTAVQLAFALRLTRAEADLLLHAAGYHLSRSVVEDMIFDACLEAKIYKLEDVNSFLIAHNRRPFVPQ